MMKSIYSVIVVVVVCLAPIACKEKSDNPTEETPPVRTTQSSQPEVVVEADDIERIKIKTPDDIPVLEMKVKDDRIKLEFGSQVLRGEMKKSGKRKYELEGSDVVAEVKPGDKGFKVRTPEGNLLWKVKITDEKIKISDNEENENPYELKVKGTDEVKVERNGVKLGKVKFYRDRGKVKVKDASEAERYESNTELYSALYGVLLMDDIPERERYIIMAELLLRAK